MSNQESFEEIVKPVIEWLNKNANPHAKIVIDTVSANLLHGHIGFYTEEFLKD